MFQSRTHTCGELRLGDAGKTVTLVRLVWRTSARSARTSPSSILRDFYGTTQVVIETEEMMDEAVKALNKESTMSRSPAWCGSVPARTPSCPPAKSKWCPPTIEVLGRCRHNELPFEINRSREADETARLKYRYLDLRNPAVKEQHRPALQRGGRPAAGHDRARLPGDHHPHPDRLLPRGRPGLSGALPQAPRQVLRPAPGSPAVQAAADDLRLRPAISRSPPASGTRTPGATAPPASSISWIWRWPSPAQEDVFAVLEDVLPPIFAKYGTYNIASSAPFTPHLLPGRHGDLRL